MREEHRKTILLVEDETFTAMAEEAILEKLGYAVITVASGGEAVAAVRETPGIDLILMDINLGAGMDGTEAAAAILKEHDLPVVFLSSHTGPEIVEKTEKITSYGYVVKDSSGTVLDASIKMAFKLFAAKIGEKKKEEALSHSHELMKKTQSMAHLGSWDLDLATGQLLWSDEVYHIFGLRPQEFPATYEAFLASVHPGDRDAVDAAYSDSLRKNADGYEIEHRIVRRHSGEVRYVHEKCEHVRDAAGRVVRSLGMVHDITRRKLAEEEIKRQLAEKEILLKEVHHRIKNNIASVKGLLALRLQAARSPEAVAALQDASGRVDSMNILYEKLLLGDDYQEIPVKNYLESLAAAVISMFPEQAEVKLEMSIADFQLDPKRLFPLGIIVNELLTNTMKYAFAAKQSGRIRLALARKDRLATLTLADNGRGLPAGFDPERSKGFGLMLVTMLSKQLGGSFSINRRAGTRCRVEFNV